MNNAPRTNRNQSLLLEERGDKPEVDGSKATEAMEQDGDAIAQIINPSAVDALVLPVRILALIAVLTALVIGESVFVPLALAVLISLALRPLVRALQTMLQIPAPISAAFFTAIIAIVAATGLFSLGEPAKEWLQEAPNALRAFKRQASEVRGPLEDMRETQAVITELRGGGTPGQQEIIVTTEGVTEERMMLKTSEGFAYSVATLVMLFFILGWGDRLFRNAIALLPGFSERRGAVLVAQAIEGAIGRYLLMITIINIGMGLAVAGITYAIGLPNPVLWGAIAAVLNYMPYIGAAITTLVLIAVSLIAQPLDYPVLTAPLVFLVLTTVEGYLITPYAVGKSLTLNPLVVFFSLLFCFFLWGGVGALLAVPILVSLKVVLEGSGRSASLVARVLS